MSEATSHPGLVTSEELAKELNVDDRTILRWAREGKIPSVKISPRTIRFNREAVLRALEEQSEQTSK